MKLVPAATALGPAVPTPDGKRVSFGWPAFAVPATGEGDLLLGWSRQVAFPGSVSLRITTAIDDRERKRIAVFDPAGTMLGEFDLRYAHSLETFAVRLAKGGNAFVLRMVSGTSPLWCFAPAIASQAPGFAPHLLDATAPPADPAAALLIHLCSTDCRHAWGWMEGCVLDGLERLARLYPHGGYERALRRHLAEFFTDDGRLLAETSSSVPCDDAIDTIESTLMFAPLALAQPDHPWLDRVAAYWKRETASDGTVLDGAMLSAEGSYTIAYPMARIGTLRGDPLLVAAALRQLEARSERLWHDGALWLRWYPASGERTFRNWARGVTWHFLGSVRTALELADDTRLLPAIADIRRLAAMTLRAQRADGLWSCFLDDPVGLPDTSGSAGIATALALAARAGWIDPAALNAAARTWAALMAHVTGDGRLGGVAQGNRGGEELQRSDYRVLSAMGAGLAGQLHAALAG